LDRLSIYPNTPAMGRDEGAISVSGHVYRGDVKCADHAYNATTPYKRNLRNHLVEQVETLRIGDKAKRSENGPTRSKSVTNPTIVKS
jgi:hypothetical protein